MDPAALAELLGVDIASVDTIHHLTRRPQQTVAPRGTVLDAADLIRRLGIACELGHADLARLLLHAGAAVNVHNTRGLTPLFSASSHGHVETALLLIEEKADPSLINLEAAARAPLHSAAKRNDPEMIGLLLSVSADVHARARHRKATASEQALWLTPLQIASLCGQSLAATTLLEHADAPSAASLLSASSEAGTALHCAAQSGDVPCARELLASGARIDLVDRIPPYTLGCGLTVHRGPPLLCALLRCATDAKPGRRASGSCDAATMPHTLSAAARVDAGLAADARSADGVPGAGALTRHMAMAMMLLDAGASSEGICSVGPVEATATIGEERRPATWPLVKGERIDAVRTERSLLEVCCMAGLREAVGLLLRRGATTGGAFSSLSDVCSSAAAHGHDALGQLVRSSLDERAEVAMRALLDDEDNARVPSFALGPASSVQRVSALMRTATASGHGGDVGGGIDVEIADAGRKARKARARKGGAPAQSNSPSALDTLSTALLDRDGSRPAPEALFAPRDAARPVDDAAATRHDARAAAIRAAVLASGSLVTDATAAREALAERSRRRRAQQATTVNSDACASVEGAPPLAISAEADTMHIESVSAAMAATELISADLELFCCPLSRALFTDPVCAPDGYTYERDAIATWLRSERGGVSPINGEPLMSTGLIPNRLVQQQVERLRERMRAL